MSAGGRQLQLEAEVLRELARLRENPLCYVAPLRARLGHFAWLRYFPPELGGNTALSTAEGTAAVEEAIAFLERQPPLMRHTPNGGSAGSPRGGTVSPYAGLVGRDAAAALTWGEYCWYGPPGSSAQRIVEDIVVDDGVITRAHRQAIFSPDFAVARVRCKHLGKGKLFCRLHFSTGPSSCDGTCRTHFRGCDACRRCGGSRPPGSLPGSTLAQSASASVVELPAQCLVAPQPPIKEQHEGVAEPQAACHGEAPGAAVSSQAEAATAAAPELAATDPGLASLALRQTPDSLASVVRPASATPCAPRRDGALLVLGAATSGDAPSPAWCTRGVRAPRARSAGAMRHPATRPAPSGAPTVWPASSTSPGASTTERSAGSTPRFARSAGTLRRAVAVPQAQAWVASAPTSACARHEPRSAAAARAHGTNKITRPAAVRPPTVRPATPGAAKSL
eukprot:CAMPEP_0179015816 /NCGR_PEP_ID=MMETSP0796-20121207/2993_1 /TAXON_ID=73915 /ORGANISM="Pyrodinium bahamense, Strain pbaha01" /LENGTH=449 /DNA_ID=CAMNT_0020711475 /DNA_START=23 /DNA_END=1369 /DNA_ORIENTATION=+